MTTVDGGNVNVFAFEGGGDDMDAPIKVSSVSRPACVLSRPYLARLVTCLVLILSGRVPGFCTVVSVSCPCCCMTVDGGNVNVFAFEGGGDDMDAPIKAPPHSCV